MIDYFFFFVGNACVLALLLGVFRGYFNRVWACVFLGRPCRQRCRDRLFSRKDGGGFLLIPALSIL